MRRRTLLIWAIPLIAAGGGAAAWILERAGVDLYGRPWRLTGFVSAWLWDGCWPRDLAIACRVDGRPWRAQNSGKPWSVTAEPGECGQRFELRKGERWSKDVRTRHMTERNELSDFVRQPTDEDIWLSFRMMIEPGPPSSARWMDFGQLHNTPDAGENDISQIFTHGLEKGDRYFIKVRGSPADPLLKSPPGAEIFIDDHFRRGHVYDYVVRLRLDPFGKGIAQVWRDGRAIADYEGPLGYVDRFGPYFKYGLYRSIAPAGETMVGHFSCLRIGPSRAAIGAGR